MSWISAVFDGFALAAAARGNLPLSALAPAAAEVAGRQEDALSGAEGRLRLAAIARTLRPGADASVARWPLRAQAVIASELKPHQRPHGLPRPRPRYRPAPELKASLLRIRLHEPHESDLGRGRRALAAHPRDELLALAGAEEAAAVLHLGNLTPTFESESTAVLLRAAARYAKANGLEGESFVVFVGRLSREHESQTGDGGQLRELEESGCLE